MSSNWRRSEALLPLRFNDGRELSAEWLAEAVLRQFKHPIKPGRVKVSGKRERFPIAHVWSAIADLFNSGPGQGQQ